MRDSNPKSEIADWTALECRPPEPILPRPWVSKLKFLISLYALRKYIDATRCNFSFIPKRLDWIHKRGFSRRIIAKEHTDECGEYERQKNRHEADLCRPLCKVGDQHRRGQSEDNSNHSAQQGQCYRLNQKLQQDRSEE